MNPVLNPGLPSGGSISGDILPLIETERHFAQVVQSLAAAVYTCDEKGYIQFFNKAAVDLWGREPQIGKDLWCGSWKIFRSDGSEMDLDECPMARALKQGKAIRGEEIVVERPDGIRRTIMPHPDPIFDTHGVMVGAVNMLVDITDLKTVENQLRESESRYRKAAEELEKRVDERTKDLTEANKTLKRTNDELEQFAFIASHDMQEPLRKIKTFSKRLHQKSAAVLDEVSTVYLDKIKTSSERMEALINDVLNYSRTAYLDTQFVTTDLNYVLRNVLDDFEIVLEESKAVVTSDHLPVLKAIPLHMTQLLHNLISNGLKFCKERDACLIEIKSRILSLEDQTRRNLRGDMSYYEIAVHDNGIGFSQEYGEVIFKIFERLNHGKKYDGSGIGLALCRKIVTIHQGDIYAESEPGRGTTIFVILPMPKGKSIL